MVENTGRRFGGGLRHDLGTDHVERDLTEGQGPMQPETAGDPGPATIDPGVPADRGLPHAGPTPLGMGTGPGGTVAPKASDTVQFVEDARTLQQLIFWNTLSTFMTLGLYRFWARTRLRRHFWHRVIVAGSPAEYMGHGFELFAGFVVIFLAAAVAFLAFLFSSIYAYGDSTLTDLLSLSPIALLPLLLPLALFRARRYRLNRTVWRGIHLSQDGSVLVYMAIWAGSLLLTILTLGLAYPARNLWTERYRLTHTLVGDQRVTFGGRVLALLVPWLPAWLCGLVLLAAAAGGSVWWELHRALGTLPAGTNNPPVPEPWADFYAVSPALWGLAVLVSALLFYVTFVRYRVVEFRYVVGHLELAGARFSSMLSITDVFRIVTPGLLGLLGYAVLSGVTVASIYEVLRALPSHAAGGAGALVMAGSLILMSVGLLFAASYGVSVISNVTLRARLIGTVARSLEIDDPKALDRIGQGPLTGTGPGEGLADALAFGDF